MKSFLPGEVLRLWSRINKFVGKAVSPPTETTELVTGLVLMPSAKLVPVELQAEFGAIPSAMVPLKNRPAVHYAVEPYLKAGYQVMVAVHEGGEKVNDYLDRQRDITAQTIDVGPTSSLGETVLTALDSLQTLPQRLVINFADTFVGESLAGPDVLLYARTIESYRWTTFEIGENKEVVRVIDKDLPKPAQTEHRSFVGVFSFSDPQAFITHLRKALRDHTTRLDPFYRAVIAYHNALPPEQRMLQEVQDWRDFGHLDTYYATKQQFFMDTRFFNHLSIDASRGVLRKSSREPQFAHEVRWYINLPSSLEHLVPRVLDHDLTADPPYVEMEYYGYPALSGIYLYGDYSLGEWESVLGVIGSALDQMQAEVQAPKDPATIRRSLQAMYVDKTMERFETTLRDPGFSPFHQAGLCINKQPVPTVAEVLEQLPKVVERSGLLDTVTMTVLHGDLCLSNILYDRRSRVVRLVDPRGSFGDFRIHGDPRYDLAKLSHSFSGCYDFLSHGLFDLDFHGPNVSLTIHRTERHGAIKRMFSQWLASRWGDWSGHIQLIESLLFLSMVPLHKDRPDCQKAFLARGLELFTQAVRHEAAA